MRFILLLLMGYFLFAGKVVSANQQQSILLGDSTTQRSLNDAVFFFDYDNQIDTAEDVHKHSEQFVPLDRIEKRPQHALYSKWVRLTFDNRSRNTDWVLSFGFARLPKLAVYQLDEGTLRQVHWQDAHASFSQRPIQDPQMYLPLDIKSGKSELLIEYQTFANAPANLRLHSHAHYLSTSQLSILTNASLAGVVAAILLIVIVNLAFNRNTTNVFYALWTLLFLLIVIDMAGFSFQYFWPDHGFFSGQFSIALMATVPIFHLLFVRGFLQLKHYHPTLNSVYIAATWLYIGLVPTALYLESVYYNLLASTFVIPLFVYTCIWSFRQRGPGMRTFTYSLINHLVFLNLLTIVGASYGNLIDVFDITSFIKVGYLIEVLLFTVALALQHKSLQGQLVRHLEQQVNALNRTVDSERQVVNEQVNQLKAKEEQLFTDLSHELRTPLTVMKIQVESLQYNIVENVEDSYAKLMAKIDELHKFIDQLMLVTGDKEVANILKKEEVKVAHFMNETFQTCMTYVDPKKARLEIINRLDPHFTMQFDRRSIGNAILEVVKNALKYGGDGVDIKMSALVNERNLVLRIEDSGMPLSYDAHRQLFQPLFREEASRSSLSGGKGMGLAVCKKIIECHGGKIDSHNSLLGGLCIEIILPTSEVDLALA
ncbi:MULTISPECIES: sensor histidine kinase [unclassified Pseudoalteromonas]|uniref:sensor histidine kinase n=1 Tax=unclassified Pseudoalteromonas TaxID=194690 RepID=UPI00209755A6|nr:sensor histidine kinase [Pseudoalteromonas sp. XMcav2-N]MCO7187623.1 sensor histidine kinase [Pseudoalteromonas sp. XMcav2-N]